VSGNTKSASRGTINTAGWPHACKKKEEKNRIAKGRGQVKLHTQFEKDL
jgi:hypothetical protein